MTGSSAFNVVAFANNNYAIDQSGSAASGNVTLDFSNTGTIDISAGATAIASVNGAGTADYAYADAHMHRAFYQHGNAAAGDIDITGLNDGTFDVSAIAKATATIGAAQAQVQTALSQYAFASLGDAHVSLANSGTINEMIDASGQGNGGFGAALAELTSALFQGASAGGDASVDLTNSGAFNVQLKASAVGDSGAFATAFMAPGIEQVAVAGGAASAAMTNSGSIVLDVAATAHAATGNASAVAFVRQGIGQVAIGGSSADIAFANDGKISIAAVGTAAGDTAASFQAGSVASSSTPPRPVLPRRRS